MVVGPGELGLGCDGFDGEDSPCQPRLFCFLFTLLATAVISAASSEF